MKNKLGIQMIFLGIFIFFFTMTGFAENSKNYHYPKLDSNITNLRNTVKFLTDIRPYRNYKNTQSLDKVASHISDKFKKYGYAPKMQYFESGGKNYVNIIGVLGKDKKERIIVGAHYDVDGDQPGADDNASAVAGLLEIARLAKKHVSNSKYRIDFVAYSLEETPHFGTGKMGSYVHAKSMHDNGIDIRGMICLEMIGYYTTEEKSQKYPFDIMKLTYPTIGNFIAVVGNIDSSALVNESARHLKAASINVEQLKAPSLVTGVDFSDHRNYWVFNYKAVMITDTAFYRNPNYHRTTDTIDTLDFDKMSEVVKGITWLLMNIQ